MGSKLSRRGFLKLPSLAGLGSVVVPQELFAQYRFLAPVSAPNPLAAYPNHDWERMYGISIGMTRPLCSSAVRTTPTTLCSMRSSRTTWSFASSRDT